MFQNRHKYYVYIMASYSGTLYVGVTNNLLRRVQEHKEGKTEGFTKRYGCNRLVYYECYRYVQDAIEREKKIKGWKGKRKEGLIKEFNPFWGDVTDTIG
jgi:putative endonuclease